MNILELIKDQLKIDFKSTVIESESATGSSNTFEIAARDFLRFAKLDYKSGDDKGHINALTNAKRAIDCQVDTVFSLYGISFDKLSSSTNQIIQLTNVSHINLPHKLKLIQAMGFAPSGLISKTRTLRNKLEHYYQAPKEKEVADAIELAELFILSLERNTKMIPDGFIITDKKNYNGLFKYKSHLDVSFNHSSKEFTLTFFLEEEIIQNIVVSETDFIFYALIKLSNNLDDEIDLEDALIIFLKMIEHPIPAEQINISLVS